MSHAMCGHCKVIHIAGMYAGCQWQGCITYRFRMASACTSGLPARASPTGTELWAARCQYCNITTTLWYPILYIGCSASAPLRRCDAHHMTPEIQCQMYYTLSESVFTRKRSEEIYVAKLLKCTHTAGQQINALSLVWFSSPCRSFR